MPLQKVLKVECLCCVWKVLEDFSVGSEPTHRMGSCGLQCDVPHQWTINTTTDWQRVCKLCVGEVSYPVSATWHSSDTAYWSKYQCYK